MAAALDVAAALLVGALVYCLYAQHMAFRDSKDRERPATSDDGSGEQSINLKLVMGYADNAMIRLLFAATLVALIVPVFFGRGGGGDETPEARNAVVPVEGNAGSTGLDAAAHEEILKSIKSADVLPVDLESMLVIDAGSADEWARAPALLRRDATKSFVLGIADMTDTLTTDQAEDLAATILEGFEAAAAMLGRGKVMVATVANGELYDSPNTILDAKLGIDHTLHALGTSKEATDEIVRTAAARCFADGYKCARIVHGSSGLEDATNAKVRQAMLSLYTDAKTRCALGAAASRSRPASAAKDRATPGEDDLDDDASDSTEGPGWLKLFILWLTRLLGFIYPLAQTRAALISGNKSHEVGGWRAYWTIFAAVHMLEDTIFVHLVYLMPIYIVVKLVFLGWCVYPDPDNALLTYNLLVETIRPSEKTKND